jgi:putative nucleotidyltransferase with HDIG domain
MNEDSIQQLRAEVIAQKNLPTIPTVLTRILQLVEAESARATDLVDVIEHDQVLTAKILRLANSAFFGQSRRVSTIPRAVVLLGFSTVRNLALGVKVWEALAGGLARQRVEELWEHSVSVAAASKLVVSSLRAGDPDEAFTAGLLHDVGRIVLAVRHREAYWEAVGGAAESEPIEALERASFGVDHAEVGGWLLESWNLPPNIVEAARTHHQANPRAGVPGLLAVTNRLIAWTDIATGTVRPEAAVLFEQLTETGVTPEFWQAIVVRLRDDGALAGLTQIEA